MEIQTAHAKGESSGNLISGSWPHSSAATCCQKQGFKKKNSNRCESRRSVWISRASCQQESALVANEKKQILTSFVETQNVLTQAVQRGSGDINGSI